MTVRLAIIAVLAAAVLALSPYPFDDAFIHLRLARNLAFHGEPYFNLGERVMSGSSPLWMLWLAAVFHLTNRASIHAAIVTECLVVASLFLVSEGFLAHSRSRSWGTIAGAFVVTLLALPSAGGLMETPLAVALFIGGLWAFRSGHVGLAGVILGLAWAARFEMLLAGSAALVLAQGWKVRLRFLAAAGLLWVGLAVFLRAAFGSVALHTMAAKAIVYQMQRWDLLDMGPPEFGK
jgi:hypothetical protein